MHTRHTHRLLAATMTTIGAIALVGTTFVGTADATGGGHGRDPKPGAGYTEDDDHNDGGTRNNVADSGDNRHPSGKDRSVEHGGSGNQGTAESDPDDDGRGPDRSNGGPDKPNGSGGVDKADQDGNNGCGNDDDFEDDNEGWCGNKPKHEREEKTQGKPATTPTTAKPVKVDDRPATTPAETCPAGMVDTNGAAADGCVAPEVLGAGATDCPMPSAGLVMPAGCDVPMGAPASVELLEGEVLSTGAFAAGTPVAIEPVSVRSAAPAGILGSVAGALAFTGVNLLTLLVAALLALAAGWVLLRADRRRNQA